MTDTTMLPWVGEANPIKNVSAFNRQGQRSVAGVLKAYFDGSGKPEDPRCRFVTLAGLFADDAAWGEIERLWAEILAKYQVNYSHMRELLGCYGQFRGWQDVRKADFVRDLCLCLMKAQATLIASCLTVDVAEYKSVMSETVERVKPIGAICVDYCLTHAFQHPEFANGRVELFFDKDEPFIKFAERIWTREKSGKSWATYVSTVAAVEMKEIIPVQIADLLAWSHNRRCSLENQDVWTQLNIRVFLSIPYFHDVYKRQQLIIHPGFFNWRDGPT